MSCEANDTIYFAVAYPNFRITLSFLKPNKQPKKLGQ